MLRLTWFADIHSTASREKPQYAGKEATNLFFLLCFREFCDDTGCIIYYFYNATIREKYENTPPEYKR